MLLPRCIILLSVILFSSTYLVTADDSTPPFVEISGGFSRATAGPNGALFFRMKNLTDKPLCLQKASCDSTDHVELHTHIKEGDVFRMAEVPEICFDQEEELKPGGLHVMLMGLKHPLKEGKKIEVTLTFDNGQSTTATLPIKNPGHKGCGCKHKQNK